MRPYSDKVWRLFREPRRYGQFEADEQAVTGQATTPASHAVLHLHLKLADDGRVDDALFQALGCPAIIAAGAWLCAWLIGRKAASADKLEPAHIAEQLQLPATKRFCAVMAVEALNDALQKASKQGTVVS